MIMKDKAFYRLRNDLVVGPTRPANNTFLLAAAHFEADHLGGTLYWDARGLNIGAAKFDAIEEVEGPASVMERPEERKIDPLEIKVGGYYSTRNCGIVGPLFKYGVVYPFAFDYDNTRHAVTEHGRISISHNPSFNHPLDLIEQVEKPVEPAREEVEDTPADRVFPQHTRLGQASVSTGGMTLRQYYAGKFMAGLITTPLSLDGKDVKTPKTMASAALLYADTLIALEKETR